MGKTPNPKPYILPYVTPFRVGLFHLGGGRGLLQPKDAGGPAKRDPVHSQHGLSHHPTNKSNNSSKNSNNTHNGNNGNNCSSHNTCNNSTNCNNSNSRNNDTSNSSYDYRQ